MFCQGQEQRQRRAEALPAFPRSDGLWGTQFATPGDLRAVFDLRSGHPRGLTFTSADAQIELPFDRHKAVMDI